MKMTFNNRILNDLKESRINWKVIIVFIPIAFLTYIFHEFGHWIFGEFSGNDMTISLNNSAPKSGYFMNNSQALWSAIGGPLFTIIQALAFLFVTWKTKSIYAYSVTFLATFSRFFSIIFGGINLQDEARIAAMMGVSKYLIAAIVLTILFLILWKCSRIMKLTMKAIGYFTVLGVVSLLIVIGVNACKPDKTVQAIEKTDSCKLDPDNKYEVYIPQSNKSQGKLPLLVILDPHAAGKSALGKFKQAADRYPAILVASDLVKNGYTGYDNAIRMLIEDVRHKYPAGETVFIAGFSGGARMALGFAMNSRLNGLILCGALAGADQIRSIHCPIISISGMDDFNFVETAQFLFKEQSIPANLKIELTNASHDWPDSLLLADAFGFLYLSTRTQDIIAVSASQLKEFNQHQHSRIEMMTQRDDFLNAAQVARNMSSTTPFNSDKSFISAYTDLKANPSFISQLNRLQNCLNLEINARQSYLDAFMTKDSLWWKKEIGSINQKVSTEQDPFTIDMYRRMKGYWGIACYSLGKQAVIEQNADKLNRIVVIYHMLEPENPYATYLSAFPALWKGDSATTIIILKKAVEEGFTDMVQLRNDFPETVWGKI
jgi:hypothetical protein